MENSESFILWFLGYVHTEFIISDSKKFLYKILNLSFNSLVLRSQWDFYYFVCIYYYCSTIIVIFSHSVPSKFVLSTELTMLKFLCHFELVWGYVILFYINSINIVLYWFCIWNIIAIHKNLDVNLRERKRLQLLYFE